MSENEKKQLLDEELTKLNSAKVELEKERVKMHDEKVQFKRNQLLALGKHSLEEVKKIDSLDILDYAINTRKNEVESESAKKEEDKKKAAKTMKVNEKNELTIMGNDGNPIEMDLDEIEISNKVNADIVFADPFVARKLTLFRKNNDHWSCRPNTVPPDQDYPYERWTA